VAVASAGPYASLHLTPDKQPCQHPTTQIFIGRMPFLPPNQQRQSSEGIKSSLISAGGKSLEISDMVFMGSYTIPVNQ